jgi:hypothetical protein
MDELWGYLIVAFIGFLIGGAVGAIWLSGFFPAACGGLILGLGGCCCLAGDFFV